MINTQSTSESTSKNISKSMSKKEAYLAAVASEFRIFLRQAFNTVYPNKEFMYNWHIDAIIHCLEQSIRGEMPRLIINMPPRHLKSFIASVALPAWILAKDPTAKIICISYSDDLAKTLSRDFRRIVESEWYIKLFPKTLAIKSTENEFVTSEGGFRYATSVGGTLTGRGGDFIVIDDPIKPEDTHSDKIRKTTNDWYKSTLLSRLDDKKRSVLILVMQRLHVNDLTGFVEGSGAFHKLSLPAIGIRDEEIPVNKHESYFRLAGSVLHDERDDIFTIEKIRDEVGSFNFTSQYQQRPETPEGSMFKRKWFNIITSPPKVVDGGRLIISIDSALSISETVDYTAITLIYATRDGHYVLDAKRGRWDYEMLLSKSLSYAERYKDNNPVFLIEYAGSGISLTHSLRKKGLNVFYDLPTSDKQTRAAYVLPPVHQGRLFILDQEGKNDWVEPFINELVSFPNGRFDDQVDSLVQALYWAEPRVNSHSKVTFYG